MTAKPSSPRRARRATRATSRPGPDPLVLRGFTPRPTGAPDPGWWHPDSPAGQVLGALSIGASWYHASHFARLHERTAIGWNARGAELLGQHLDFESYAPTAPDDEHRAYVAFHLVAAAARVSPVAGALQTIDRARKAGDWRAAAHMLRVLPQARDYTEVSRQEIAGPDDGPVRVDVSRGAEDALLNLARRIAGEETEGGDGGGS